MVLIEICPDEFCNASPTLKYYVDSETFYLSHTAEHTEHNEKLIFQYVVQYEPSVVKEELYWS